MASWLDSLKVVVCTGTGGVGKTTMAASIGLKAAQSGRKTLVLTVDPARRLADALGLSLRSDGVGRVNSDKYVLDAAMIDAKRIFTEFVQQASPRPEVADRLLKNRLFQQLTSTISGSQEFTSLERLLQAVESDKYDLIVLDTPPTNHAIDFLRAPERIFALFQDSVTRWFVKPSGGLIQDFFSRGTQTVLSALEAVTGKGFLTELSEFFIAAAEIQSTVAKRSIAVHRLLAQSDTGFVLVTAFDEAKLKEGLEFASELGRSGHHLRAVIINRALPDWLKPAQDKALLASGDEVLQRLVEFHGRLAEYYESREKIYLSTLGRMHEDVAFCRVPEGREAIEGISGLERVIQFL